MVLQLSEQDINRRHSDRVTTRFHATLHSGDQSAVAHVINISCQGALVAVLEPELPLRGDSAFMTFADHQHNPVSVAVAVTHCKQHLVGLSFSFPDAAMKLRLAAFVSALAQED